LKVITAVAVVLVGIGVLTSYIIGAVYKNRKDFQEYTKSTAMFFPLPP